MPARVMRRHRARIDGAFTLAETLIVVGIVSALAMLILPLASRARQASRSVNCLSNLRHMSVAFRLYAQENTSRLPYPAFTGVPWERALSKYSSPDMFRCPSDLELGPVSGSSYDWRDTGDDTTTLAGRSLDYPDHEGVVLVFDAMPSWHESHRMNAVFTDGSARSMDQDECGAELARPVRITATQTPLRSGPRG